MFWVFCIISVASCIPLLYNDSWVIPTSRFTVCIALRMDIGASTACLRYLVCCSWHQYAWNTLVKVWISNALSLCCSETNECRFVSIALDSIRHIHSLISSASMCVSGRSKIFSAFSLIRSVSTNLSATNMLCFCLI